MLVEHSGLRGAVGRSILELVPDLERFWIDRYAEVDRTRRAVRFEQRSDAMARCFDVHAFPVGDADGHLVGLLFNDMTRQRSREANREFLSEVAAVFESETPIAEIMAAVGARLGDFLGTNSCLFCEVDEAADTITTSFGWTRAGEPNLIRTFRISDYLNEAFLAESRARRTVTVADTERDPRTDAAAYAGLNIRSFVTVPYYAEGVWTHFFAVTGAEPRPWTIEETELLQSFARLVFSKLERARAVAALRESEARFRAMADALPQIVWITDAHGSMEFFNRHWSRYTGIDFVPETAVDVALAAVHPEDVGETMARFKEALDTGATFRVEHRIRAASGEYRWFLVRAEPEMDAGSGRPRRWYGASVDIHDRTTVEHALADTDRRKDEFLATLAHELRNPLAPIRTGLAFLDRDPPADAAARTRAVMSRQLAHMVHLIDDLLDISRINTNKIDLKREVLDLRTVVAEAIDANRPVVDQGQHRLFVSVPSEPLPVNADRTRLVQVFGNLISNAAKYTPLGGRIDVSADDRDGAIVVQVADSGIGIEPWALEGIFDLFAQLPGHASRAQGGLRIGLSLVKRLVEMHGGVVEARSPGPGRGSTFEVRLPREASGSELQALPASPVAPAPGRGMDILIVDDNVDAALMMRSVLELDGHRIVMAHSGLEAGQVMETRRLDVAFVDIGLPGLDGYGVACHVRGRMGRGAPILIALTGWGSDADRQRAFESGFEHHLTKPVDVPRVRELLAELGAAPRPDSRL